MNRLSLIRKFIAVVLISLSVSSAWALSSDSENELVAQAQQLLEKKQPEKAYQLLTGSEFEYAGSARFDYMLGMSALAAGRYTEATLAFERVLIVKPNHVGAMLDTGLAYLKLGNRETARKQFKQVLAANPPEHIRAIADEGFRKASGEQADAISLTENLTSYVAMTVGHDSNINSASSDPIITYPGTSDNFAKLSAGLNYQLPVSETRQWVVDLSASSLAPFDETENRNLETALDLSYQIYEDNQRWSIGAIAGYVSLDNDDYLHHHGVNAGWRYVMDAGNLLDVTGRWSQYRYDESAISVNDFDQTFLAVRLLHRLPGKALIASLGVLAGVDDAINGKDDGDSNFYAVTAGLQGDTRFADIGFLNMSLKRSDYQNTNVLIADQRKDSQFDLRAGLIWVLQDSLSLTGQVRLLNVSSNVDVYSYERMVTSLTLRKDFD